MVVFVFEVTAQIRKWGRSLGIVIPKEATQREGLKEGNKVRLVISKPGNSFAKTFGLLKQKRPTKELLNEIDREGWDE